jgi:hypothetical protein
MFGASPIFLGWAFDPPAPPWSQVYWTPAEFSFSPFAGGMPFRAGSIVGQSIMRSAYW